MTYSITNPIGAIIMTNFLAYPRLFTIALIAVTLGACSKSNDNAAEKSTATPVLKIDGSSTVYPITEAVAEEFQADGKVNVTVGISGTGGGFKKFCRGETDVQNASRPILEKEIAACKEAGIEYVELPIAYDALTHISASSFSRSG